MELMAFGTPVRESAPALSPLQSVDPPTPDAPSPSDPPEFVPSPPSPGFPWRSLGPIHLSLDRLGTLQAIGGLVLGLVAL
jgi:hypothetical protein